MIYTAQYRYSGQDRLDITVKGNCPAGKLYAPTWDMVTGVKNGTLPESQYTKMYYDLLLKRWQTHSAEMLRLVWMTNVQNRDLTFVCFCPANTFCHRYLLVKWLRYNWQITYGGERSV